MKFNTPLFLMNNYELLANKTTEFYALDTQELHEYHVKELGPFWRYFSKKILYKTNSIAYRTKNLNYYKDKDFILVLGDSHTFGTGLAEDEIYHYHIGNKTNLEILNAGYGAIGPDLVLLNSFLFMKNFKTKPKAVIIQWPSLNRISFKGNSEFLPILPQLFEKNNFQSNDIFFKIFAGLSVKKNSNMFKFYRHWIEDDNSVNHSIIFIELTRMLWKMYGVPYIDFTLITPEEIPKNIKLNSYDYLIKDLARDQVHYGNQTHKLISTHIYKKLKNYLVF